jgi:hypothetical protein
MIDVIKIKKQSRIIYICNAVPRLYYGLLKF